MDQSSPSVVAADVYDISDEDAFLDLSSRGLTSIPETVNSFAICTLYLQNNAIERIPDDFFPSLPSLMWLDLRDNQISTIPETIRFHPSLSHILLQNNKLQSLPSELGTLTNLKTLQISGNPLTSPPRNILNFGIPAILKFLNSKFEEKMSQFDILSDNVSTVSSSKIELHGDISSSGDSTPRNFKSDAKCLKAPLSVQLSDRAAGNAHGDDRKVYTRGEGKCPKLARSRQVLPHYAQSRKYLKPQRVLDEDEQEAKMRRCFLRELAQESYKEMLAEREKILQSRKNMNLLEEWRKNYKRTQLIRSQMGSCYAFDPNTIPYDTDPEHMMLLSREDLEKDLPDKYRRRLTRRSKPCVPRRKSGDQALANKIKQLFENLEKINLNKDALTPRTEQKMLLNEIHKISEIRNKLSELSSVNFKNIAD